LLGFGAPEKVQNCTLVDHGAALGTIIFTDSDMFSDKETFLLALTSLPTISFGKAQYPGIITCSFLENLQTIKKHIWMNSRPLRTAQSTVNQ
jgi:hypothetical protein